MTNIKQMHTKNFEIALGHFSPLNNMPG